MKISVLILVALVQVLGLSSSFAADPNWDALVQAAIKNGKIMETDFGQYRVLTFGKELGHDDAHEVEYFSAVGGLDSQGNFGFSHVEAVVENWTIDEKGNSEADQWIFSASADGQLVSAEHYLLIETVNGSVISDDAIAATDAEKLQKWNEKLAAWESLGGTSR